MTNEQKQRYNELLQIIHAAEEELIQLNPYARLKQMSNKEFGEQWSESYILSKVPHFKKDNGLGHDFIHPILGKIEVKSCRLPCSTITYNQCHPDECDHFLFVNYDTIDGTETIYLVPSIDISNDKIFSKSKQHSREGGCYTVSGSTWKNAAALENYKIGTLENLYVFMEELECQE